MAQWAGLVHRAWGPDHVDFVLSVFQHWLAWACEHLRVFHPGNHSEQNADGAHCGQAGAAGEAGGGFQVCLLLEITRLSLPTKEWHLSTSGTEESTEVRALALGV